MVLREVLHLNEPPGKSAGSIGPIKLDQAAGAVILADPVSYTHLTLIQYIELSCFLGDGKFPQRPVVQAVNVLNGVAHVHGDLLPGCLLYTSRCV